MEQVKIFVEGEADRKFISDYLNYLNISFLDDQINTIGGKSESHIRKLENTLNSEELNLFILDSDNDNIEARKREIQNILSNYQVNSSVFLYPNNIDNGTFEDLLKSMSWPKYAGFFECYRQFNSCIASVHADLIPLDKKDEVYAYLSTLVAKGERSQRADQIHFTRKPTPDKPNTPSYMQDRFWDLNCKAIQPLKEFLLKHLSA